MVNYPYIPEYSSLGCNVFSLQYIAELNLLIARNCKGSEKFTLLNLLILTCEPATVSWVLVKDKR